MSATQVTDSAVISKLGLKSGETEFFLAADALRIREHGIEFRSAKRLAAWTEMNVTLVSPVDGRKVCATGVVVDCQGSRHTDYSVSLVFTEVSQQAQKYLTAFAHSALA